jgi:hypothetical protein
MYQCETDLDLPEIRRVSSNFWKAKYFECMREIAKANTGIRRLRAKLDRAQISRQQPTTNKAQNGKA